MCTGGAVGNVHYEECIIFVLGVWEMYIMRCVLCLYSVCGNKHIMVCVLCLYSVCGKCTL